MDIVGAHYDDIKSLYISRDKNKDRKFNEDAFNDAFIKCSIKFANQLITYDDVIKYFWIAYVNTSKSLKPNNLIEFDINFHDKLDNKYNENVDILAKEILYFVEHKFGKKLRNAYELYVCYNWKITDLIEQNLADKNFPSDLKKIKLAIQKKYKDSYKSL